jgi:hypothetical protein
VWSSQIVARHILVAITDHKSFSLARSDAIIRTIAVRNGVGDSSICSHTIGCRCCYGHGKYHYTSQESSRDSLNFSHKNPTFLFEVHGIFTPTSLSIYRQ